MQAAEPWLPDLCRTPRIAAMIGVAELVVVVLALAPDGSDWDFPQFVSASGYAMWLAMSISLLLCVSRRGLSKLPMRSGAYVAVLLVAAVALVAASAVHVLFASVDAQRLPPYWRFVGGSVAVSALIGALSLRYFYVIDRWQAQVGANARAQADALQARIRPHFLFNSMNMIASLLRRDPVVAERAVLDLSDLFRAALGAGEGNSTLAEEVELVERYLDIEQLRLGDRLQVRWDRAEPLPWTQPMPRLVLQPLIENAVLHGISRLPKGGAIEIGLRMDGRDLRIAVRNPSLAPGEGLAMHGAGHAQTSIGHRLAYAFGSGARMTAGWDEGYYRCELQLPLPEPMVPRP